MAAFIESRRRRGPEDSKKKKSEKKGSKNHDTFSMYACHPCAGTMLIFSVSFQFLRMTTRRWFQQVIVVVLYKPLIECLTFSLWVLLPKNNRFKRQYVQYYERGWNDYLIAILAG